MGWMGLAGAFGDIPDFLGRNDDDVFDRISHRWTAAQFVLFAILVSTKQYVGESIVCWVPSYFPGPWTKYTNSYCWINNTYYLKWNDDIPNELDERSEHPIIYYQWVPLILLIQALMFYLPITIWRTLNNQTGIDVNDIVETSERLLKCDDVETKRRILKYLSKQINRYLRRNKAPTNEGLCKEGCKLNVKYLLSRLKCCCSSREGNYMSILYIFIKVIFLGNAIGQLFLINTFLGPWPFHLYGIDVFRAMAKGEDWRESPRFPRVTMCDVMIRRLGNLQRYSFQCVLPINLFNEKIYLYIWFLLLFVILMTFIGLVLYILRLSIFVDSYRYVKSYLLVTNQSFDAHSSRDKALCRRFVYEYLRSDGMLVMRLIDHNTNKINMQDVLSALWDNWIKLPHIQKLRSVTDDTDSEEDALAMDGMGDV